MGTVREVSVEYGRTVNLGNFESERLAVSLTETVHPDEAHETVARELITEARAIVQGRLRDAAESRRLEQQRGWGGGGVPPRPRVDEEDDPTAGGL
jgi:hypothetical protein